MKMAMYIQIRINENSIVTYGIQRASGEATGINPYKIFKYVPIRDGVSKRVNISGSITHKYEDGAVILAKKALDFIIMKNEHKLSKG